MAYFAVNVFSPDKEFTKEKMKKAISGMLGLDGNWIRDCVHVKKIHASEFYKLKDMGNSESFQLRILSSVYPTGVKCRKVCCDKEVFEKYNLMLNKGYRFIADHVGRKRTGRIALHIDTPAKDDCESETISKFCYEENIDRVLARMIKNCKL